MKTVYFVRHGESELNARLHAICIPDHEAKLTQRGVEQSRFIAERARHLKVDALLASPFVRTRDTAAMISDRLGIPVEYSELFEERHPPTSMVGKVFAAPETQALHKRWADAFYEDDVRVEDGETFAEIRDRARRAFDFLDARPEERLLVVTHGFFLRIIIALTMFGDDLTPRVLRGVVAGTRTDNTGISMLTKEVTPHHDVDASVARWRIRVFNDHAHLG